MITLDRYDTEAPGCFGLRVQRMPPESDERGVFINIAGQRHGYMLILCSSSSGPALLLGLSR